MDESFFLFFFLEGLWVGGGRDMGNESVQSAVVRVVFLHVIGWEQSHLRKERVMYVCRRSKRGQGFCHY